MLFPWKIFFKYEGDIGYRKIFLKIIPEAVLFCFARRITLIAILKEVKTQGWG